jgi:hypothetical protein
VNGWVHTCVGSKKEKKEKKEKAKTGKPDDTFFRYLEDDFYLECADPNMVFSFHAREASTNSGTIQ